MGGAWHGKDTWVKDTIALVVEEVWASLLMLNLSGSILTKVYLSTCVQAVSSSAAGELSLMALDECLHLSHPILFGPGPAQGGLSNAGQGTRMPQPHSTSDGQGLSYACWITR